MLTSALYAPFLGLPPVHTFSGDLILTVYLLSLLTMCIGLAGWNTSSRFSLIGSTRTLTQMFAYEGPFLLALLGPALVAGSWQISEINQYAQSHWMAFTQPVGFIVALIGLMGKLELPPFDSPEAETEIVAGALTEYSGRGLAIFKLGKSIELIVGITLVSAFYLGGLNGPVLFLVKTLVVLVLMTLLQTLLTAGRALYFSRAPIPWSRDAFAADRTRLPADLPALRHVGLYAYRTAFLLRFPALPRPTIEQHESLEQLRALAGGVGIAVLRLAMALPPGVDTPRDLERVRALIGG